MQHILINIFFLGLTVFFAVCLSELWVISNSVKSKITTVCCGVMLIVLIFALRAVTIQGVEANMLIQQSVHNQLYKECYK